MATSLSCPTIGINDAPACQRLLMAVGVIFGALGLAMGLLLSGPVMALLGMLAAAAVGSLGTASLLFELGVIESAETN